jgi:hypothetical protein
MARIGSVCAKKKTSVQRLILVVSTLGRVSGDEGTRPSGQTVNAITGTR